MKMREALFLSSKDATFYTRNNNGFDYRIRVDEDIEEYNPLFELGPGPHFRTIYCISVSVIENNVVREPHHTRIFYDIEGCEEYLRTWRIDTEVGWKPEETEEAGIASLDALNRPNVPNREIDGINDPQWH